MEKSQRVWYCMMLYNGLGKIGNVVVVQSPCRANSSRPHILQHARPPCLSSSPGIGPGSCSLHWWCHPIISSSDAFFSSALDLSQNQGLFQWVVCLHQVTKILELQLQDQSFQWISRVDFPKDWLAWSPCCPREFQGLLQQHNLKASILWHSAFFMIQLSQPDVITGKTITLTIWTFVGRVPSLLFNTVYVCPHFPAKKQSSSDFIAAVTVCSDFGAQEEEICHYFHISPFYLPCSNEASSWFMYCWSLA